MLSLYVLGAFFVGLVFWALKPAKQNPYPLPPGPPAEPIFGHARLIPTTRPEVTYAKWTKDYNSDVLYLNLLGKHAIILNSQKAATDLLDRRGANYSDRPRFPFFDEMGWRQILTFYSQGPEFRKHRRMFNTAFSAGNCLMYRDGQQKEARKMLKNIVKDPTEWRKHMVFFAIAIIIRLTYGIEVTGPEDPLIELADKGGKTVSEGGPAGATFVDIFPFVRALPHSLSFLIPSLKFARDQIPVLRAMKDIPFGMVEDRIKNKTARDSFLVKVLRERAQNAEELQGLTDEDLKGATSTIFTAGQDTTWSQLMYFVLAMTYYPEIQKKAWAEIESVVGHDRLPEFSDQPNLPYLNNVVKEAFRWNLVVPLGIPHVNNKDDEYNGYFIPKGSLVIANGYAIHRDAAVYKNPERFDPDRFIPKEQGGRGEPAPEAHFGFGRRLKMKEELKSLLTLKLHLVSRVIHDLFLAP
ncbi:hypothetical protein UA08_08055 [Talaromyces atroroseus]|uniref:Cytochrome P450 n=1 Tax=Talaromyces atroroseus TaxID=1441469 RepID=A0A225ALH5_TALAT|nr:hypothetical protein UA08_08055 [Talaromyces atroroseus]OKL56409.1 hypothetical protein UA08_08055 [Talaromyces atroroseus]